MYVCVCHYFIHVHLIMQRNQITSVIMTSCMASRDGTKQITTSNDYFFCSSHEMPNLL